MSSYIQVPFKIPSFDFTIPSINSTLTGGPGPNSGSLTNFHTDHRPSSGLSR